MLQFGQMIFVRRLAWDDWNIAHIARHGVTPEEVEAVCHGDPMTSETYKERVRIVGATGAQRTLTVILAPQGDGVDYPVTARPASREERQRYEESKGDDSAKGTS